MMTSGLGDMARYFTASRQNADIRTRLDRLSTELSSGRKADPATSLGAEAGRLPGIDRRIAIGTAQVSVAEQLGQRLSVMQIGLETVSRTRGQLFDDLAMLGQTAGNAWHADAAGTAAVAMDDITGALNTRFAGASLFSGTSEDVPTFARADTILADIRATVAGATTAQQVSDALDAWFHDPGAGFETVAYQGDGADLADRRIDDLTTVRIEARGDDTAIREVLKGAAMAALTDDAGIALSDAERDRLAGRAGDTLLGASGSLAALQGRLGASEARTEEARARIAGQLSTFGVMRNELVAADPFETATALEQVQTQLETHYAVTARLSGLSLTRYL